MVNIESLLRKDVSPMSLQLLIVGLQKLMKNNDVGILSEIMREIEVDVIAPEMLIAVLRTTFVSRARIVEWPRLLLRTQLAFKQKGLPETLLQGLDRDGRSGI